MSSFSFAPQQYPQRETQKNYVFVDEHNRHKRLKGQLQDSFRQMPMQQQQTSMIANAPKPGPAMYATHAAYPDNPNVYQHVPYSDSSAAPQNVHYTTMPPSVPVMDQQQYAAQHHFPSPPHHQGSKPHSSSPGAYSQDEYQQQDLSDLLGSLKMDEAGSAPYLRNRATFRQEEEPAVEEADEYKSHLPALLPAPGLKIRIPPELMPDDDTAEHYLDLYFGHVHPYVPVLSKTMFYQQWNSNRDAISPLILEAIFAIGGRLADEPAQGQQWLALASNHADAFMDIPRLSTLQALLIILKAREAAPKRGYYYRSWMTVVQCVQMAKDLGLDEHYSDHQTGRPCDSSPMECQLKSRIWQTIFVCEVMVGSPQGRTDLAVELDTIDFSIPRPIPGADELEYNISRNFTYLARIVKNISRMNTVYGRLRKTKKDWGVDPDFVQLNPSLNSWLNDLPGDLSVTFPPDGSAPWLSSPFIGNLHSYYYLAQILLHRPQLAFLDPNGADGQWKHHMMICYNSAKALCRLQEAVVNTFGFTGLQCMQRGFSFTIYCGLTCIVLHLVAITSPDPDLNVDARDYFARHMRVLERVMSVWPMADLQKPVDARIFEQWNTSFGQPEAPSIQDIQAATASMPVAAQQMPAQQYSAAPVQTFVTPAMWQESVASVYEGGLKRAWDYEGGPVMKRQR
ncbi:hypothetical protein ACHAPS_004625 [Verticillium nonalfalfae]